MHFQTFAKTWLCLTAILSSLVYAYPNPPHTWHIIKSIDGAWEGKLQMLNQGGAFVTRDGTLIKHFTIHPQQSLEYGFSFDRGDDFDVAYSLTLTQKKNKHQYFESKACVYVITASGPAKPDIRVSSFNQADCKYNVVHGKGEDFEVS